MDQPDILDLIVFGVTRGLANWPVIFLAAVPIFIASPPSKNVTWRQRAAWPLAIGCTAVAMIVDALLGHNPLDFSLVPSAFATWILSRIFHRHPDR